MPTSTDTGWTLIETLVVVVVVSILASMVVLRLGDTGRAASPHEQLEAIASHVDAVCQQALLSQQVIGLGFDQQGLYWLPWPDRFEGLDEPFPSTQQPPSNATVERGLTWASGMQLSLRVQGMHVNVPNAISSRPTPPILCTGLGERTAFELHLSDGSDTATLAMSSVGQWSFNQAHQSQ